MVLCLPASCKSPRWNETAVLILILSSSFTRLQGCPQRPPEMSSNILGTFWYLKGLDLWATTKPYFINVPQNALPEGQRASNEVSEPANGVLVRSMRDANAPNDIDLCGFSYRTHDFDISAEVFRDSAAVRRQYIPRVEEWLQQITGAETVHTLTFEVCDLPRWLHAH